MGQGIFPVRVTGYNDKGDEILEVLNDPSLLDFFTLYEIDNKHYILKNRSISLQYEGVQPGDCEFYLV